MVAIAVVTLFIAILAGMGISVFAFGTGGKRSKVFQCGRCKWYGNYLYQRW